MGDVSAEPSMEDILASIKRIIAEDVESGGPRARRRAVPDPSPPPQVPTDENDVLELSDEVPAPVAADPVPAPPPVEDAIVSAETAEASRAPLDNLSKLVVKREPAGTETLEGMVREMLRPMLREWLDHNLPSLVESMVAREIERITRGQ